MVVSGCPSSTQFSIEIEININLFISVYSYLQLFLFCDFDFAMRFAIELHGSQTRESREAENRPAWQISLRMAIDSTVS